MNYRRRIHRPAGSAATEIADSLQTVFVAELLAPGRCLWLISPWVSDAGIIDNSAGGFAFLDSTWGYRRIRLSEVLIRLLTVGSTVVVASRPEASNEHFLQSIQRQAAALGIADRLILHSKEEPALHEKGLLTERFYIAGSMNFTYRGIEMNEEVLTVSTQPEELAEVRLVYHRRWGGGM